MLLRLPSVDEHHHPLLLVFFTTTSVAKPPPKAAAAAHTTATRNPVRDTSDRADVLFEDEEGVDVVIVRMLLFW